MNSIGNYMQHAKFWDWSGHDRSGEHEYWTNYAVKYGKNILIPMCALGETGAYMAEQGFHVTAFDYTPEMIEEGLKRFGNVEKLQLFEGDITNFQFNIDPADFCFCSDFGHIHDIENLKKALVFINNHLRDGGCLVIETGLSVNESNDTPLQTFYPVKQVYSNLKVWKTGETRNDVETGRCYISQTFYAEDENGNIESFDHSFYLQNYSREIWLSILKECGFEIKHEYKNREKETWCDDDGFWIVEAVKIEKAKTKSYEILYQLTNYIDVASSSHIEWLTENDFVKFNEHLLLVEQKPIKDEWFQDMYRQGKAQYCLLYNDNLPVARGAVEPLSEQVWEAADIRTAKDYRNKGFAKEMLRFLSQHIIEQGKMATCRTEKDNAAMQKVLKTIGYKEMEDNKNG